MATAKKSRILFVLEYYYPHIGGVEFLFQYLAEHLVRQGYDVGVVTARVNNTKAYEVINGVHVHRAWVPKRGARYFFTFFGIFWVLPVALKYNVIHTTTYNAAVPGSLTGLLLRKKVLLTVHEVWVKLWPQLPGIGSRTASVFRLFEKAILGMPYNQYFSVSHATEKALLDYKPSLKSRSHVVYNGINYENLPTHLSPSEIKPAADGSQTILYFGRPGISKGVENLIAACNACTNKNLKFRLVVSKDEDARYNHIASLIKNPAITIEPSLPRAELFKAIQKADYVIIPSLSEGFGFAALEASIYGQRLICSNQAALPEVVSGKVAFYNPWKIEELTQLLNTLSPADFTTIPVKKFPIAETAEAYQAFY